MEILDAKKLRGGYYTPDKITRFLSDWAINDDTEKVLEPSCGDGNFIVSIIGRMKQLNWDKKRISRSVKGIELIKEEAAKAKKRVRELDLSGLQIHNQDFFTYIGANGNVSYDAVVGNPPFIRYQNFPENHRERAISLLMKLGLNPNKLTNIWVPFLVISSSILSEAGKLGMVVPAELFQVKYAAETRIYLSEFFERITIITFKKLVFKGIQQEVVLLLCEKKSDTGRGIRVVELGSLEDLDAFDAPKINAFDVKEVDHSSDKWTKYFLDDDEINLLRRIRLHDNIPTCNDIMDVDVGIVTGRNKFFMLGRSDVKKWKLGRYVRRVVSRSAHLKGIKLTEGDFESNDKSEYPIYLFLPPDRDFQDLPKACQEYVRYGVKMGYHKGYKCRIRKRWYITPSLWNPDAFALRQVNGYPKLILNNLEASATDTIHRVRLKTKHKPELVVASYLNSLTFAFSEVTGRSYGGGVMTFEPTEVEELPIPIADKLPFEFNDLDKMIREKKVEEVLDEMDRAVLEEQYGFTKLETRQLRNIWKKLSLRRIGRK